VGLEAVPGEEEVATQILIQMREAEVVTVEKVVVDEVVEVVPINQ